MIVLCSKKNTRKDVFGSDRVLDEVLDSLRKNCKSYGFLKGEELSVCDVLYSSRDDYEGRSYKLTMTYCKFVKIGRFLVAKGVSSGTRVDPIGSCLAIIPIQKGDKTEDVIKNHNCFNTQDQSVIFSYNGELYVPYTAFNNVGSAIMFVLKPSGRIFYPDNDFSCLSFLASGFDCCNANFVKDLVIAFQCSLGLNNEKTRQLKAKIDLANRETPLGSYSGLKELGTISSLQHNLDRSMEIFGKDNFDSIIKSLNEALVRLNELSFKSKN